MSRLDLPQRPQKKRLKTWYLMKFFFVCLLFSLILPGEVVTSVVCAVTLLWRLGPKGTSVRAQNKKDIRWLKGQTIKNNRRKDMGTKNLYAAGRNRYRHTGYGDRERRDTHKGAIVECRKMTEKEMDQTGNWAGFSDGS